LANWQGFRSKQSLSGGVNSATDKERRKMESVRGLIRKYRKAYQLLNGCCWRKAAVRAWDELATEDLARPVDATHLQRDQLKLLKLLN
jgi:hypothetical protein